MPMSISNNPNMIIKVFGGMFGRVFSKSSRTIGPAGLAPITFSIPNQKKIIKRENLAKGMDIRLRKFIKAASIRPGVLLFIRINCSMNHFAF